MLAILAVFVFVLFAAILGRRALSVCGVRFESTLEEWCFPAGLGLGIVSSIVMAAGLLGALRDGAVHLGALAIVCLLIPDAVVLCSKTVRRLRALRRQLTPFQLFLVAAIVAALACGLVASLAPPTAWDATTSHLKVPLRYMVRGEIYRLDDLHSNGPLNATVLFMPVMQLGGDAAPALLNWAFMLIGGLALVSVARRHLSRTGVLVAAAAYFLMPITAALASEAVVDFAVVAFFTLAFAAFVRWWDDSRTSWLMLGAIHLGLMIGTKYTGLFALGLLFAGIVVRVFTAGDRASKVAVQGAAAVVLAAVVGCPWYVRNAELTGNPFYPVLADVIPTRHISVALTSGAAPPVPEGARHYPRNALDLLLFPVNYTLGFTRGVRQGPVPEGAARSPGPLLLAFAPLLLLLRPRPWWAWLAVGSALGGFVLIAPVSPMLRYLLPFVVPCVLVVGHSFERLAQSGRWARVIATALVVAVLLLQLVPFAGRAAARFSVVAGRESRDAYLMRTDEVYPVAKRAAALPPRSKVLYVGLRMYHFLRLDVDAELGMPCRQAAVDFPAFATATELLGRIRDRRYTHVVVNETLLRSRAPLALGMLEQLKGGGLDEVERRDGFVIYAVTAAGTAS